MITRSLLNVSMLLKKNCKWIVFCMKFLKRQKINLGYSVVIRKND